MKQKILNSIKHPLISGSLIMFFGSMIGSVLNFLFNLFMSRNLTVADYGILASLTSIISLAMVVSGSAVPMLVNFAANYFAKNDLSHVRGLFMKTTQYYVIAGGIALLIFLIFPQPIGKFFNISQIPLIILSGFIIFIIFVNTVNGTLLQARLAFGFLSFTTFLASLVKLIFGVFFFFVGWKIMGAMWALLLSFFVSYIISLFPLKFLFNKNLEKPNIPTKELFSYGIPAAVATFGVTMFITTDIMLVKHFFSPTSAGIYAGLSLVGRVIYFLTAPISGVMFPLISQKHAKKEAYDNTFLLAFVIVLLPSLAITLFYFIFPTFSINIFIKKKEYLQTVSLLGIFGIFITIYSLLNVFANFFLSIKKTNIWIPIAIAALMQVIGIWIFHKTFIQVITSSLIATLLLLVYFIIYYFRVSEKN